MGVSFLLIFIYLSVFSVVLALPSSSIVLPLDESSAVNDTNGDPCVLLTSTLPRKVSYPRDATYKSSAQSYFYQQARLSPRCIVSPQSSEDVSRVVEILAKTGVKAAIRGGGHTPFPGASNINDAVTIDLTGLNAIVIDAMDSFGDNLGQVAADFPNNALQLDNSSVSTATNPSVKVGIVSVGGGATWGAVYAKMQGTGFIPVGGRGISLGVGGLITGGGLSFYSPSRGFSCDNVINFQVVTAAGAIMNVNHLEQSDLFQALKGGSNNFGIVTRFDLQTYPDNNLYGGFITYPGSTVPQQLAAFSDFMEAKRSDPAAEVTCKIGYSGASSSILVENGYHYTKPVVNPWILRPFTGIQPQNSNTMRLSTNLDFVTENEERYVKNARGIFVTTVFFPTPQIIRDVFKLWLTSVDGIKSVEGITYSQTMQRMPAIYRGNSMGLTSQDEYLVLYMISATWKNAADDGLINRVSKSLIDKIEAATKAAKLYKGFKYLNYAASFQDPISSYGVRNRALLQGVSRRYDEDHFFQNQIPGGFKVFGGVPAPA